MSLLLHSVLSTPRRKLEIVAQLATITECISIMKTKDIGAVVVMEKDQLIGIVSERDIIRNAFNIGIPFETIKAIDIVFKDVPILSEHDSVEKAMKVMIQTKRRHILIEENHEYAAIISIGDLLFHLLDDDMRVIQHLEKYIVG